MPLHVVVFTLFFYGFPELRGSPVFVGCLVLMWLGSFGRAVLWKVTPSILAKPNGIKMWRTLFAGCCFVLAIAWGIAIAMIPANFGVGMQTCMAITMCLVLGAGSVSAYSFDLPVNIAFNSIVFTPTFVVICMQPAQQGLLPLAGALMAYILFILFLCLSMNRSEIELLHQNEVVAAQGASLKFANSELKRKGEVIGAMFQSIDEAFLFFDADGFCTNNPSERSQTLLGMDPAHKHMTEILHVPAANREAVTSWYRLLFSDRLRFDEIKLKGPGTIEVASNERVLKASFHALRDDKGVLQSVIFTASDVTRETRAHRRVEEERERADMILRVNENKTSFRAFLADFERLATAMVTWKGESLAVLQRDLHTLKGAALMFGAKTLSQHVYETELQIRASSPEDLVSTVHATTESLRRRFINWKHHQARVFTQLGVFDEDMIEISRRKLGEIERRFSQTPLETDFFSRLTSELLTNDFGDLLGTFEPHVISTAEKVEKKVSFHVERPATPILVKLGKYREPLRGLVHLFNNAVDHGIETPADRVAAGKPASGKITLKYDRVAKDGKAWIEFSITDDGHGIDVKLLRDRLAKKGRPVNPAASDLEVAMNIFDDGMTTRDSVTDLSGQGIGMGAVRESVLKARGSISIGSTGPQGTTFVIRLPDTSFASQDEAKSARGSVRSA